MSAVREPGLLTFRWPDAGRISFLLPGFIALSALAHVATFYVFQITYPHTVSITPPPVQVSLLTPDTTRNAALFRWIEAEDPAIVAMTREVSPPGAFDLPYRPSYSRAQTLPKPAPQPQAGPQYPPGESALEIAGRSARARAGGAAPIPSARSAIRYSGGLSEREVTVPAASLQIKTAATLQPATFLVGVNETGEILYVFLQSSSGEVTMDRQAEAHLNVTKFAPSNEALVWGFATYFWGADAYAANPKSK